jgi:chromosome segregation ATPase
MAQDNGSVIDEILLGLEESRSHDKNEFEDKSESEGGDEGGGESGGEEVNSLLPRALEAELSRHNLGDSEEEEVKNEWEWHDQMIQLVRNGQMSIINATDQLKVVDDENRALQEIKSKQASEIKRMGEENVCIGSQLKMTEEKLQANQEAFDNQEKEMKELVKQNQALRDQLNSAEKQLQEVQEERKDRGEKLLWIDYIIASKCSSPVASEIIKSICDELKIHNAVYNQLKKDVRFAKVNRWMRQNLDVDFEYITQNVAQYTK